MADPAPSWYLIDTPQPDLFSIGVVCQMKVVQGDPANWPREGDLLSQNVFTPIQAMKIPSQYGNYQFVTKRCDGPNVIFIYGPDKTEAEKKTPYRKQWKKFANHRWSPILKSVAILEDRSFPQSSNFISLGQLGVVTSSRFSDRFVYVPDANEGTRFFLEEYFAATYFTIPRYRVPLPTAVQYSINGLNNSFPECLHDDIDIPAAKSANAIFLGGNSYSGNGSIEGQYFPRTNFKTWLPYVLTHEQESVPGGWYAFRIRVFPPTLPKAIRQ